MGFEERRVRRLLARNTLLFFAAFAVLFSLFGVLIFQMVSSSIYQPADNQLAELRILTSSAMADWESGDGGDGYEVLSDGNLSAEAEGVGAGLEESMADDADEGGIAILNRSYVASNPQLIYLWRHADGKAAGTEGLYASYPAYFDDIPFDPGDLDRAYEVRAGGHVYRGINYAMGSGGIAEGEVSDRAYVQVLVNVDSEMALLEHFTRVLVVYLAVAVAVAAAVSFLLSRRTVKPIVASMNRQTEFVQNASHELRTPLAVIKAECEYALSDNASEEDMLEALSSIDEQTDKMTKLVTALLTLSRTEQGDKRYKLEDTNLSELVKKTCADFVPTKNITLTADIEDDIIIPAQAQLISLMLENLLSNAVKYGRDGGHIEVRLKKDNGIVLSVKDDGIGIKEEDLPKIWSRFYRADESRSRESGFGLGLSLVSQIAALHGGKVSASSVYGEGSEFTVTF